MREKESEDGEETKMVQSDQDVTSLLFPLDPGRVDVVLEELDELPDEWLREEPIRNWSARDNQAMIMRPRTRAVTLSGGRAPARVTFGALSSGFRSSSSAGSRRESSCRGFGWQGGGGGEGERAVPLESSTFTCLSAWKSTFAQYSDESKQIRSPSYATDSRSDETLAGDSG